MAHASMHNVVFQLEIRPEKRSTPEFRLLVEALLAAAREELEWENAAKHTPSGTSICIGATVGGQRIVLTVDDVVPGSASAIRKGCSKSLNAARRRATSPVWAWVWRSAARSHTCTEAKSAP